MTTLGVDSYSNGSVPESCYTMLPGHISPGSTTSVSPITCPSGADECSGLSLTVTQNGTIASHYSCDTDYEGSKKQAIAKCGKLNL